VRLLLLSTLVLHLLCSAAALGQILAPPEAMHFHHAPFFNPEYIHANGIKEIRAVMETKKDGDRIRSTHREMVYLFDEKGQSAVVAHINRRLGDTSITAYQFAERQIPPQSLRLACEVHNDAGGLYSYCYTYNADGQPTERRYARLNRWRKLISPDFSAADTKINTETYHHVRYDDQLHSTLHNSAGRPYLKEIRYYDAHGYMLKYLRNYVMASDRHEEQYTYNAHGWLASVEVLQGNLPHRIEYQYDDIGNLLVEERYEGGLLKYHKEFVYEGSNMSLRAELVRREGDGLLEITTYSYTYK
jgi:hypothetical protein